LTYSITGAGWLTIRSATFAVSIAEPPPTETNPSTPGVQREIRSVLERVELGLDARAVVDDDLDPLALDRLTHPVRVPGDRDAGVGDEQCSGDAEPLELPARVLHRAGAELDRRRLQGEDRLARGHEPVIPPTSGS
jgi:hypothetical protein